MSRSTARSRFDYLSIIFVFLATTLIAIAQALGSETQFGSLKSEYEWDFGYLPQKSLVGHRFWVQNTGNAPLRIKKIEAGCSCTAVSSSDSLIAPLDSALVTVAFNSGRYTGRIKKTTKIHTDNPASQIIALRFMATVIEDRESAGTLRASPMRLVWSVSKSNSTAEDTITISNSGRDSLSIGVANADSEFVKDVKLPASVAPTGRAEVVVSRRINTLTAGLKGGSLTLVFEGRDTTRVTVPIQVEK